MLTILVWHFCSYFVVPLVLFIFCYGRIVVVMRRQMKVMAAHNVDARTHVNTSQLQSKRVKWNIIKTMIIYVFIVFLLRLYLPSCFRRRKCSTLISQQYIPGITRHTQYYIIKTMIIVSVAYVICFFPNHFYFIIVDASTHTSTGLYVGYFATVFLSYLYLCMNPFIYAIKHEGVKEELFRLMAVCRKRRVGGNVVDVALGNTGNTSASVQTNRPGQAHL